MGLADKVHDKQHHQTQRFSLFSVNRRENLTSLEENPNQLYSQTSHRQEVMVPTSGWLRWYNKPEQVDLDNAESVQGVAAKLRQSIVQLDRWINETDQSALTSTTVLGVSLWFLGGTKLFINSFNLSESQKSTVENVFEYVGNFFVPFVFIATSWAVNSMRDKAIDNKVNAENSLNTLEECVERRLTI